MIVALKKLCGIKDIELTVIIFFFISISFDLFLCSWLLLFLYFFSALSLLRAMKSSSDRGMSINRL